MNRIVFYLLGVFLVLLPWHAFFVTWFASVFSLSSSVFAIWKEVFIFVFGIFFLVNWWKQKKFPIKFYKFDYAFFGFLFVALLSAIFLTQDLVQALLGFKYDFEFFILFYLLRGLSFSVTEKENLLKVFGASAIVVILSSLIAYHFFPGNFLSHFGYLAQASTYSVNTALPMFHNLAGGDFVRLSWPFSGPNHFAFYLIVVGSFLLAFSWQSFNKINTFFQSLFTKKLKQKLLKQILILLPFYLIGFYALILTFSRSAWLAAVVLGIVFVFYFFPKKLAKKVLFISLAVKVVLILSLYLFAHIFIQDALVRKDSSSLHWQKTTQVVQQIIHNPLGTGLGTAGPASMRFESLNTVSVPVKDVLEIQNNGLTIAERNEIFLYDVQPDIDALVDFKAKNQEELDTVFSRIDLGEEKILNIQELWNRFYVERIAENWHLQMFQEFGIIGGILWLVFCFMFLQFLLQTFLKDKKNGEILNIPQAGFLAFLGLCVAGLFLHSFEASSVSLSIFALLALVF